MALTVGIVGLPNVGKTCLFNALTNSKMETGNYMYTTTTPNVGTIHIPDKRLDKLKEMYNPKKTTPALLEVTDIPGLARGSYKGEGLGNQFLKQIREVDAIIHLVRCFNNKQILHVDDTVDALRDIDTINFELIFADLEVIEKRLPKIEKKAQAKVDNCDKELAVLTRIKDALMEGIPARNLDFTEQELLIIKNFSFLTLKPMIYVGNISETDLNNELGNEEYKKLYEFAKNEKTACEAICCEVENTLSELDLEDKQLFLDDLHITETGLDKMTRSTFLMLGLRTFFTAGEKEVRAWQFKEGMKAPQCAGVIHGDFERGFIKAEVCYYDDLITYGSIQKAKEANKVRLEGKEYIVKDGDIVVFRFNV